MAVYQEKDKNKWTKDGRKWYFRIYYLDMYGNKKQKQSKLYFTKKDAIDAEYQFKILIKTEDITTTNIDFKYVFYEWLNYKKTLVKYTTFYGIKLKMEKYILPVFENFKLHSIKTNNLLLWKDNMIQNSELNDESLNKTIGYFQELLEYAKINYDFSSKVANKLQKSRISRKKEKKNDSKWNFWTPDEFSKFISSVEDPLDSLMYNFMYYTGLRIGEVTGLTWNYVDLDKKTITIENNLTMIENGGFGITDTKTENSERTIDLDDNLVKLLKEHLKKEEKIYNFNKSMYVFGNIKYISFTTLRRHLYNNIEKANVKKITPHGFRHSHASLLIDLGCDSRDVADRLGDTVEMVERTYYHMFPEKKSRTVQALNKLNLGKTRGK